MTYKTITDYLPVFSEKPAGRWVVDDHNAGTEAEPINMAHVVYSDDVQDFIAVMTRFQKKNPLMGLRDFNDILKAYGIRWDLQDMQAVDLARLDARGVLALILAAIESERFHDGALLSFFESGSIQRWLERLAELDEA